MIKRTALMLKSGWPLSAQYRSCFCGWRRARDVRHLFAERALFINFILPRHLSNTRGIANKVCTNCSCDVWKTVLHCRLFTSSRKRRYRSLFVAQLVSMTRTAAKVL